ncbi:MULTISPECIES: DUF2312 domain-containing protein [Hyphomonas]|mgnify:FL=1|jgi:uncharacterized protein (UPF0335 family)|uniref:GapR-like DNA-binding domain-containing protein n=1 Tax=Hyphomonas johnsonii MHS-2 TaxID=1280950 RepID=A0A059FLX3_9PROT|nr:MULTISPECIES: DUF2312 domain-containing protein [Hyphomonas]KCZ91680.1 hypothetical protein HJO_11202 [Hyphomonas johnsonii MHS-2]KJS34913.1 MAG: hypothetical protein VR74_18645 [Hyphomonas sp. BRH_c22]|tara:strand:+ start:11590 stop:11850 length:261 start_codon:yes stop_codon:yes gene_type:complete
MDDAAATHLTETTKEKLRQTVAKIERLEEEKKEVAEQIKEIYAEAKAFGFDVKALRQVIRLRKVDKADREEQEMMLELYLLATGDA